MGALTDSRADEGIPDLRPELGLLGLRLKGDRLFVPTNGCGGAGGVACRCLLTRADMLKVERKKQPSGQRYEGMIVQKHKSMQHFLHNADVCWYAASCMSGMQIDGSTDTYSMSSTSYKHVYGVVTAHNKDFFLNPLRFKGQLQIYDTLCMCLVT